MITRAALLSLSLAMLSGLLAAPASAEHEWRKKRIFLDPVDLFSSRMDRAMEEEIWLDDEDEEALTVEEMRERRQRWVRQNEDPWWLEDEDVLDEPPAAKPVKKKPVAAKPAKKPKAAAKAAAPKPAVKKEAAAAAKPPQQKKPLDETASIDPAPPVPVAKPQPDKPAPKLAAVPPKAGSKSKPSGKTLGCTGGAAVVTGLGFASVRPRVCTGDTYAYLASKSDGNYAIKLKAQTGEVVDVRKLP